ncbi:glycine zipper family protein [Luminiphilus sp.]|nr:glycine zipper family protein [Luminiphilus sp.]
MKLLLGLAFSLVLTACAGGRSLVDAPIIDRKGVDMNQYFADKAECEVYATEVNTGEKVTRGVIGGAVVGGAIGAIVNRGSNSAERGAGVGAVTGGVRGTQEGIQEQERVVKQCLRGRGYRVLN